MNIDEAIKHCEEVAYEQDMKAGFETDYQTYTMSEMERERCKECTSEHRQLAEWLKELKKLRKEQREVYENGYKEGHADGYDEGYAEAYKEVNADDT